MISTTLALILCVLIGYACYRVYKSGVESERLKDQEAINDQNDELLEYLKKQRIFCDRIRNDADYRRRVLDIINDNKK
jgi:hypothetical protein